MGVVPAEKQFLKMLRDLTRKYGILLIFDEIMTGFRSNLTGVQGELGIIPDLTCLGKIIGGGFPIGAYGGRKDIMDHLAPLGGVYQAGTFSGNPVVMAAGLATLKLLNKDFYRTLNERSRAFVDEINEFFQNENVAAHMAHYHGMLSLRFRKEPVRDYADAQAAAGGETYARLFWHLIKNGIYWPPADLEACFICGMHTKKDLQVLSEALKNFFSNNLKRTTKEKIHAF
jgi:glutamate-1-semialdehyde 2,1-aminomutase